MNLALALDCARDEDLIFAQQLGVTHVLAQLPDATDWRARDLRALRNRVEKAGLALAGIEEAPFSFGESVRGGEFDEAELCDLLRQAGEAGIETVGYSAMPRPPAGSSGTVETRGGAVARTWPSADLIVESAYWDSLRSTLGTIVPVAERAGVRLACQVPGEATVCDRLLSLSESSKHGLDLHCGTGSVAGDREVAPLIARSRDRIFSIRLGSYSQSGGLHQAFLDEGGSDQMSILESCRDAGFTGTIRPAPAPHMHEDTDWGHKGQAFSVGYLRAQLQALESQS